MMQAPTASFGDGLRAAAQIVDKMRDQAVSGRNLLSYAAREIRAYSDCECRVDLAPPHVQIGLRNLHAASNSTDALLVNVSRGDLIRVLNWVDRIQSDDLAEGADA